MLFTRYVNIASKTLKEVLSDGCESLCYLVYMSHDFD